LLNSRETGLEPLWSESGPGVAMLVLFVTPAYRRNGSRPNVTPKQAEFAQTVATVFALRDHAVANMSVS
jgi:hypothetical protein